MLEKPRLEYLGIAVPSLPDSVIPVHQPDLASMPKKGEYVYTGLKIEIATAIAGLVGINPESVLLTEPPSGILADYALACHPLAKALRKSPNDIAMGLALELNGSAKPELVAQSEAKNGFLNFQVDIDPFGNKVLQEIEKRKDQYGEQNNANGSTVVIDCSSPNVAKFMSVGHLRSTIIGESVARLRQANGYTVIRDNHLGDWGTQFGMLARAHELWSQDYEEIRDNTDPVSGLYKLYVRIHEEVEKEKEAGVESQLEKEGRQWFQRLESGDEKALDLLKWATEQSLKEFQRVYDLLGSKYEYMLGESFYVGMLPDILDFLKNRKIANPDETGALVVDLEDQKLNRLVVQKQDGTSLYATRDLATLVARRAWFDPEEILYVVGGDQKEYFQQVFATFGMMAGDTPKPKTEHISFGMITLPEGKMSTRAGRVIFLEDVLSEATRRARIKTEELSRAGLSEAEKDDIARKVGVGAVVFFDLGQGRTRNIEFDYEKALAFEGYSGPYIQYAHARIQALARRVGEQGIIIDQEVPAHFSLEPEKALVKHLSQFPEIVAKANRYNSPDQVAQYTFEAAKLFSDLYQQVSIVNEPDPEIRNVRLRLASATGQVIKNGLNLICIEAPERM